MTVGLTNLQSECSFYAENLVQRTTHKRPRVLALECSEIVVVRGRAVTSRFLPHSVHSGARNVADSTADFICTADIGGAPDYNGILKIGGRRSPTGTHYPLLTFDRTLVAECPPLAMTDLACLSLDVVRVQANKGDRAARMAS